MAANANDYFQHVGEPGTATTLSAPGYAEGATTINVGSTTNFADDTGVIFAIDETETDDNGDEVRVQGTYNVYEGTVASGTSINNVSWLRGDGDRNYSAGASTRVYVTTSSAWADRLVDGMLVSHNQDGTFKDKAVTLTDINGGTTEGLLHTTSGGDVSGSKVVNADFSTIAGQPGGAWQSWTPTWTGATTNPVLGNGTLTATYLQIGKTVSWRLSLKIGSTTTTGSGLWSFSLPVNAHAAMLPSSGLGSGIGTWYGENPGTVGYGGSVVLATASTMAMSYTNNTSTGAQAQIRNNLPAAWSTNWFVLASGSYEAA